MTLSPQVSSKLKLWLKSMGAKEGLILDKVHLCIMRAIEYSRSSLAWWEAKSEVKRASSGDTWMR
ncbi:MAG: hypothetical protein ABIM19_09120 [candidate division WOR-3 bacterium]